MAILGTIALVRFKRFANQLKVNKLVVTNWFLQMQIYGFFLNALVGIVLNAMDIRMIKVDQDYLALENPTQEETDRVLQVDRVTMIVQYVLFEAWNIIWFLINVGMLVMIYRHSKEIDSISSQSSKQIQSELL